MGYLRELWHAVHSQEISGNDALLALAQRPLTTDAPPEAGPLDPNTPIAPVAEAPADAPVPRGSLTLRLRSFHCRPPDSCTTSPRLRWDRNLVEICDPTAVSAFAGSDSGWV